MTFEEEIDFYMRLAKYKLRARVNYLHDYYMSELRAREFNRIYKETGQFVYTMYEQKH